MKNKPNSEQQAPRPEPEAYGYATTWPSDEQRDAYHKALNSWVDQQACPYLHTVKKTVWVPYSIVTEARGWKVGDKIRTMYGMDCTVVDSPDTECYEAKDDKGIVHHISGGRLLFEVNATYIFS